MTARRLALLAIRGEDSKLQDAELTLEVFWSINAIRYDKESLGQLRSEARARAETHNDPEVLAEIDGIFGLFDQA